MSDLNGKIAIVTGANSGMGYATVEALSDMGPLSSCSAEAKSGAVLPLPPSMRRKNGNWNSYYVILATTHRSEVLQNM